MTTNLYNDILFMGSDCMRIEYKKIPNGLDDIARYLDLDPAKTLFLHSTSFDQSKSKYISRRAINKGRMLYAEILSYVSASNGGAKAGICYFNDDFLDFCDEIGFFNRNNILKVYSGTELDYPYNSVSFMLNKKVKEDVEFRKSLDGYTIVSSYLSYEDVETANFINGKVLMTPEKQAMFNSKHFFRTLGKRKGFRIAPGLEFTGLKSFNTLEIREKYPSLSVWIKLASQSGGSGNLFFENIDSVTDEEICSKIYKMASKIYDKNYIENEMPYILEIDLGSMPNTKIVENIGVNAVITPDRVTILGGTSQTVDNGKYIGSCVHENTYKYLDVAQKAASEAFAVIAEEGYYGFMTIDVLVVSENGELKAYNVDPNARFSAGTMLLKNIHYADLKNDSRSYGISYTNLLYSEDGSMLEKFKAAASGMEYDKNTGYGIVPVLLNDITPLRPNRYYLKSILIDNNYQNALDKFEKFKGCFRNGK